MLRLVCDQEASRRAWRDGRLAGSIDVRRATLGWHALPLASTKARNASRGQDAVNLPARLAHDSGGGLWG
jgi:hypothetical protein